MARLLAYFRRVHQMTISEKMAERLALTVRNMTDVDADIRLGVTGSDRSAVLPRRVDVTLGELRRALGIRRVSA